MFLPALGTVGTNADAFSFFKLLADNLTKWSSSLAFAIFSSRQNQTNSFHSFKKFIRHVLMNLYFRFNVSLMI